MNIEKINEISLKNDKKIEEITQKLQKIESFVFYLALLMGIDPQELEEDEEDDSI